MKILLLGFLQNESGHHEKAILNYLANRSSTHVTDEANLLEILTTDGPFSFIVANIKAEKISIPEALYRIIEMIGERPIVIVGDKSEVQDAIPPKILNSFKMLKTLDSPYILPKIKSVIDECNKWVLDMEFEQSIQQFYKDDMCALRLKSFYLFDQLPYDIYIEMADDKYGKIIAKNKFYSHQLVHSFSKKNIKYFYLKKDDHLKFLDSMVKSLKTVYQNRLYDKKNISNFHLKTIFIIQEYIKTASVTDDLNELVYLLSDSISEIVKRQFYIKKLLKLYFKNNQMTIAESSLLVANLCEAVTNRLDWEAGITKKRLILASILHDLYLGPDELIGIRSLYDEDIKNISDKDLITFKDHPLRASEVAKLFNRFPETEFIVLEHHEMPTGDGFPKKINTASTTLISAIFIIVTHFVSLIAQKKEADFSLKETLQHLRRYYPAGNYKTAVDAFISAL